MWISDVIPMTFLYQAILLPFSNRGRVKISLKGVGGGMAGKWLPCDSLNFIQEQSVVDRMSFTVLFVCAFVTAQIQGKKNRFFFNVTVIRFFPLFFAYKILGPYYHMMGFSVHANLASGVYTRLFLLAKNLNFPILSSLSIYVQDPHQVLSPHLNLPWAGGQI